MINRMIFYKLRPKFLLRSDATLQQLWQRSSVTDKSRRCSPCSGRVSAVRRCLTELNHGVVYRRCRCHIDTSAGVTQRSPLSLDLHRHTRTSVLHGISMSCLVAEWLACWTQVLKGPGSNRSRDAVGLTVLGKLFIPIVPLFTKQQNW